MLDREPKIKWQIATFGKQQIKKIGEDKNKWKLIKIGINEN